MIIATKDNFEVEVLNSEKPVLVDFYAEWCGPCKMLMPIVESLSNETDEIKICKVNIDNDPELAAKYNVMSVPTLVAIVNGETKTTSVGIKSKDAILDMFK